MQRKWRDNVEVGSGGSFLRLKDGESQYVIFMGELYEFFQTFDQTKMKATVVPEGTHKAQFRFRINAVIKVSPDKYEPRIFENGATVYNTLKELDTEYDGLESVIIKLTRKGVGLDTEYQLIPLRQEISPQTKALLAKLPLLKLQHEVKAQPGGEHDFGPVPPDNFDQHPEIPF